MPRSIRTILTAALICAFAAPGFAGQATARVPPPDPARQGDSVTVILRDGREIRGTVGKWLGDIGFYVKPADTAAWLIHPEDIVALRNATSGLLVSPPLRRRGIGRAAKVTIGIGIAVLGVYLWANREALANG